LKSKRAAATAFLSGESQIDLLFELQEFYKNSGVENRVIFIDIFGECPILKREKIPSIFRMVLCSVNELGVCLVCP